MCRFQYCRQCFHSIRPFKKYTRLASPPASFFWGRLLFWFFFVVVVDIFWLFFFVEFLEFFFFFLKKKNVKNTAKIYLFLIAHSDMKAKRQRLKKNDDANHRTGWICTSPLLQAGSPLITQLNNLYYSWNFLCTYTGCLCLFFLSCSMLHPCISLPLSLSPQPSLSIQPSLSLSPLSLSPTLSLYPTLSLSSSIPLSLFLFLLASFFYFCLPVYSICRSLSQFLSHTFSPSPISLSHHLFNFIMYFAHKLSLSSKVLKLWHRKIQFLEFLNLNFIFWKSIKNCYIWSGS